MFMTELYKIRNEIYEAQLSDHSRQVATYVAGYIAKKMIERYGCEICKSYLVSSKNEIDFSSDDNSYDYLNILFRGGLTIPSQKLIDYVSDDFAILDLSKSILKSSKLPARYAAEILLESFGPNLQLTCETHIDSTKKFVNRIIVNIFFNNGRKISSNNIKKDEIGAFKKRQREK